jgi:hypothetical protein
MLGVPEMPTALIAEHAALDALQRAFSKSRYLLRALSTRERLDMTRRLTGSLAEATRDRLPAEATPENPRLAALRRSLNALAGLTGRGAYTRDDAAVATTVADALLRLDPASTTMRDVAVDLSAAASAMTNNAPANVTAPLDKAVTRIAATIRAEMPGLPDATVDERAHRLAGALADADRRRGGR